jgi:hypothetical protein
MWEVKIFNTDICKSICDKWAKNFANRFSDKGYFYEPRKTRSVKRPHISGIILTAYIKFLTSFVEFRIHVDWGTQIQGAWSSGWLNLVRRLIRKDVTQIAPRILKRLLDFFVKFVQPRTEAYLTPLSCIACMTIRCSVHKSALTYKEIIFSTFSNQ